MFEKSLWIRIWEARFYAILFLCLLILGSVIRREVILRDQGDAALLYHAWRIEFEEQVLGPITTPSGLLFGYDSYLAKDAVKLNSYKALVIGKSDSIDAILLAKIAANPPMIGDEFLALAYCERQGWSYRELLAGDGLIELPARVLSRATGEKTPGR